MEIRNNVHILSPIPVELTTDQVLKQMRLHGDSRRIAGIVSELIELVRPVARPKAVYKVSCVDNNNPEFLEIDGVKFSGRLLRDNLGKLESVFIGVATCGTEVDAIELPASEVMKRYCLDAIKLMLVISASDYLQAYLSQRYALGHVSSLNPGELKSFPIDQQKSLFSILGDVEGMIGVRLTEYCALIPTKSRAGIFFSSDTKFVSCRLCSQSRCQGRKAPYNPELAEEYQEKH